MPEFVSHDTRPSRLIQVMLDMQLSERYKHLITSHGSVRLGVWIIERKFCSEDCIKLLIEGNINCVADLPSWAHIISNASFKVREGNVLNVSFVMTREDYETYRFSGTVFVYEDGILSPLTTCSEELKKARIEQVDFNEVASGTCPMRNDESRKKLILSELSETINGYEAVITFPKTAKGTLQTEFKLGNSLVALSFSDIKDEKIEIRLSCAVKPDTSHFKIHRTKGFVECKLLKDKELTFGAGVLPYTEISFTELPPFSREKVPYIMGDMFRGKWMSKMQNSMPGNMSYDDPYLNMKESIQLFGADYAAYNKINVYNMIFHDKTIDFIVYVKRFCCYKKHPMIWVKIVDMFYRGSLLKAGYEKGKYPSDDKMIKKERDKFTKALAEGRVRNIICSKDESLLLRRWLRTNAFRVAQDPPRSPVPIWIYDSFITLLYPYVHFWEGISEMVQHQNYENFRKMGKLIYIFIFHKGSRDNATVSQQR